MPDQLLSNQLRPRSAARGFWGRLVGLFGLTLLLAFSSCSADGNCATGGLSSCLSCASETADCNRNSDDGCEVDLLTDPNHCGRCDKACPGVGQQRGLCVHGVCSTCPSGRLDCNGLGTDGCETKVSSDPQNCAVCGMVCPDVRNGVAGCINASCTIASCQQGFEDCDGNPLNGCETDARADPRNCGSCGFPCNNSQHALATCVNGRCQATGECEVGYGNCNNDLSDGCETTELTDKNNCGECAMPCTASQTCFDGKCIS